MIIRDVRGDQLSLTKIKLSEKENHQSQYPFHVLLSAVRSAYKTKSSIIKIIGKNATGGHNCVIGDFRRDIYKIGCRYFSPATFAKILRAAGIKPARKPAKKGKK
jgi:hypothetical protein